MFIVSCIAPTNIALVKYWGKRNEELILPLNDSLSMTLSTEQLCTTTTVAADESFTSNRIWINGVEEPFDQNKRIVNCINALQKLRGHSTKKCRFPSTWKLHIATRNNFPTAAGLASSASGYAALVFSIAKLYEIEDEDLTIVSRQGSGSSCRSFYGGFVRWFKGQLNDGTDSFARQIAPPSQWPDMHVLIVVVNDKRKEISSSEGMKRTSATSTLLEHRLKHTVPERIEQIIEAIRLRDFEAFAKIVMQESNQFHAVALDTYPPCVYMNDVSHAIVDFVHSYNKACGAAQVAYTFDAGPNACLYLPRKNVPGVVRAFLSAFPNSDGHTENYLRGIPIALNEPCEMEPSDFTHTVPTKLRNEIKYIIHTRIGEGPRECDQCDALLDPSTGLPRC